MAKDRTGRLHVTVRASGNRKQSSKLWLERQLNDPYVLRAKREGLRSRAAFKLKEIDDKYKILKPDMAANTTGHRKTDQLRIVGLVEAAAEFACEVLKPGGTFLAKVFQSGADAVLLAQLKKRFATIRHVKPAASRQDSSERYLLATGFRSIQG